VAGMADGSVPVSGDPSGAQDVPEGAGEAFRKRQADARFTVTGPAPAWALKWGARKP
jgi:hypothetical protein